MKNFKKILVLMAFIFMFLAVSSAFDLGFWFQILSLSYIIFLLKIIIGGVIEASGIDFIYFLSIIGGTALLVIINDKNFELLTPLVSFIWGFINSFYFLALLIVITIYFSYSLAKKIAKKRKV